MRGRKKGQCEGRRNKGKGGKKKGREGNGGDGKEWEGKGREKKGREGNNASRWLLPKRHNDNLWPVAGKLEPSYMADVNLKLYIHFEKMFSSTSKKLKRITQWPSNSAPRYIPRKIKKHISTQKTCIQIFTTALFITKKCKQLKCFPADEWINKLCYIHIVK